MKYIVTYGCDSNGVTAFAAPETSPGNYVEASTGETAEEAYASLQKKLEQREKYISDLPEDKSLSITI